MAHVVTWPEVRSPRSSARNDSSAVAIIAFSSLISPVRTRTAPALVTAWTRIASRTPSWARGGAEPLAAEHLTGGSDPGRRT
jgi:hypothetical protein